MGKKKGEEYRLYSGKDEHGNDAYTVVDKDTEGARKCNLYDDHARDNFLLNAEEYLDENKQALHLARDRSLALLKKTKPEIAKELQYRELRSELASLGKKLPSEGRKGYLAKNMQPYRSEIDRLVKKVFETIPNGWDVYSKLQKEVARRELDLRRVCKEQDIDYKRFGKPRIEGLRTSLSAKLGQKIIDMALPLRFDKFNGNTVNDLARKISAKNNRVKVGKNIGIFAKNLDRFLENTMNFTRLHIAESEIKREAIKQEVEASARNSGRAS
jgi:hypothetical protein